MPAQVAPERRVRLLAIPGAESTVAGRLSQVLEQVLGLQARAVLVEQGLVELAVLGVRMEGTGALLENRIKFYKLIIWWAGIAVVQTATIIFGTASWIRLLS